MAPREHPRYLGMEFADYEFHEFPMMVYPGSRDGGRTPDRHPQLPGKFLQAAVVVNSEEERRKVLEIAQPMPSDKVELSPRLVDAGGGAKRLATEEDERQDLLAEATRLGLTVDKRWGVARLQDAIDTLKAGHEVV